MTLIFVNVTRMSLNIAVIKSSLFSSGELDCIDRSTNAFLGVDVQRGFSFPLSSYPNTWFKRITSILYFQYKVHANWKVYLRSKK